MEESDEPKESIELEVIKTPQELVDFIFALTFENITPCACGLTESEFDKYGKFGCEKCYSHFNAKIEKLVYPYHGSKEHCGKKPKMLSKIKLNQPEEMKKVLKLNLAKAIELEDYESAKGFQDELNLLKDQ